MSAIVTEGLGMVYRTGLAGRRKALDNLNLTVGENEIFGYVGPNGAGKTTTIKILVGLIYATSGTAKILGRDISDVSVRKMIGYQPENPYFYEYLSTEESLHFYGKLCGVPRAERRRRVDELIELMNIPGVRKMRVREFSKGMRQRLGLAQALVNDPKVIFLDEPLEGLDPMGRHQIRQVIVDLKERGKTVFFSSHILSDVEVICDRVGMLLNGAMRAVGSVESLLSTMTKSIEITVKDLPEEALPKIEEIGQRVMVRGPIVHFSVADDADGQKAIGIATGAGGKIVAYQPHRESLEDYFMRQAAEGG